MKNIVVLSGAGISSESGIATFRDSGGLWEQYRVEDVATPEGFARDPKLVLDFYNMRRRDCFKAQPNNAHLRLAELQERYNVFIITQNVDDLHERAGSKNVLHLHGELMKVRSSDNFDEIYEVKSENLDIHLGDKAKDGSQLRPHIVWFGEAVPMMGQAESIVRQADILLVIGTSLNVYPAAGLINYAPKEAQIYLIDPNDVRVDKKDVCFIRMGASDGIEEFINAIEKIDLEN